MKLNRWDVLNCFNSEKLLCATHCSLQTWPMSHALGYWLTEQQSNPITLPPYRTDPTFSYMYQFQSSFKIVLLQKHAPQKPFFPKEKAFFTIGHHAWSLGTTYLIQTNNNKKHPSEPDSETIMEGNIFSYNYKNQSWVNSLFSMPLNSTENYLLYLKSV